MRTLSRVGELDIQRSGRFRRGNTQAKPEIIPPASNLSKSRREREGGGTFISVKGHGGEDQAINAEHSWALQARTDEDDDPNDDANGKRMFEKTKDSASCDRSS